MWIKRTCHELQGIYKDLDLTADIKEKIGMDRISSKNGSWKGS
jgi:hypothetical protein